MVREKLVGVEDLTKLPLSMPQCCKMLGLRHGTLVHRDIVANIIRLTAYHKLHLNEKGRLQIREGKSLALTFKSLVDEFLDVRKTGIHYFPNHLPAREGWYASYIDVHDRLLWTLKNDKPKIWAGIALMFEQVKADARFSSSKFLGYLPERFNTFDGDDCEVCGSGDCTDSSNSIFFCSNCHVGQHTKCRMMIHDNGRWFCSKACQKRCSPNIGQWLGATKGSQRQLKRRANSDLATPLRPFPVSTTDSITERRESLVENFCQTANEHGYTPFDTGFANTATIDESTITVEIKKNLNTKTRGMRACLEGLTEELQTQIAMTSNLGTPSIIHSRSPSVAVDEENFNLDTSSPISSIVIAPTQSTKLPILGLLSNAEIHGTTLATRLHYKQRVFRHLPFEQVSNSKSLFEQCRELWMAKVPGFVVGRILIYEADLDGYTEITNLPTGFRDLLRLLRREWDQAGDKKHLVVKLTLLADTEVVFGL